MTDTEPDLNRESTSTVDVAVFLRETGRALAEAFEGMRPSVDALAEAVAEAASEAQAPKPCRFDGASATKHPEA